MSLNLILGGDEKKERPTERPISLEVSRTQEEIPGHNCGRVEIYNIGMTARIPTEFEGSYLIYTILGHSRGEAIIVSPNGRVAKSHYFKPTRDLTTDTGRSGCFSGEGPDRLKSTDEDTERYWLLRNPEFRRELAKSGWLVFSEAEKVENYGQRKRGLTRESDGIYKREFRVRDFIRALELVTSSDSDKRDYTGTIKDFQELLPFGEEIEYVWEGGEWGSLTPFFYMDAKHRDTSLPLRLEGEIGERNSPKTLTRSVLLDLGGSSEDLTTLVRDYSKQKGIILGFESEIAGKVMVSVKDRTYNQEVEHPNTAVLLEQAMELKHFVERVKKDENESARKKEEARLTRKREKYGLSQ